MNLTTEQLQNLVKKATNAIGQRVKGSDLCYAAGFSPDEHEDIMDEWNWCEDDVQEESAQVEQWAAELAARSAEANQTIRIDLVPVSPLPTDSAERKKVPLASGLLDYFPAALCEAAATSQKGNDKHRPGKKLSHSRGLSSDHTDCILRHLVDYQAMKAGGMASMPGGRAQLREELGNLCWRALAFAQEQLEELHAAPLAPRAVLPGQDEDDTSDAG